MLPKALELEIKKATTKTKILPKAHEKQKFHYFLIRSLIRKSNHQNQDIAESWKNQMFNYFLIRILIRKSNRQNQDIAKAGKIKFAITF